MKKYYFFLALLFSSYIYSQENWQPLGPNDFIQISNTENKYTNIAIDNNNIKYVVYTDIDNGEKITVKKFDGNLWEFVGNSGFSKGVATQTSIVIGNDNIPYVVYKDIANGGGFTVQKFNGTNWVVVGDSVYLGEADYISIDLDNNNMPYVVYVDGANSEKATVRKYNGINWEVIGNAGFSKISAKYTNIALDNDNIPYVIYSGYFDTNTTKTYVQKYDGKSWVYVGDIASTKYFKTTLQTIKIVNNEVYIAYKSSYSSHNIYTLKFDGTSNWINIGTLTINVNYMSMAISKNGIPYVFAGEGVYKNGKINSPVDNKWLSTGSVSYNSIVIDNNEVPYITYSDLDNDGRAVVKKLNNSIWEVVGTPGFSPSVAQETSMAINNNNIPYVVYVDYNNEKKASVQKFNGKNWEIVGIAGFSKGAVDKTSIVIDKNNVPYVCYIDIANDNKITVKKFDGGIWNNVGIEGFSAGKIEYPSIAMDFYNLPYVIYRDLAYSNKATVQKFNGSVWSILGKPGFSEGWVTNTSIAFTNQNVPYISYTLQVSSKLIAQRYMTNDASWKAVGSNIILGETNGSMAFDNNSNLYVVHIDGAFLNVLKLENIENESSEWKLKEVSNFYNEYGKIALNKKDGLIYIVYLDKDKVSVKKLRDNTWETIGNKEISEGNASQPSIAIGNDGIPQVAYSSPGLFAKYFGEQNALNLTNQQSNNFKISIYPNPVSNLLKIKSETSINEIIIFDLFGKKVLNNKNLNDIDVSSLINGMYLVKIVTEKSIQNFKIIKK